LLDINLPNIDGITLCQTIRESLNVPIILCTARVDEIDRLIGLDMGADDYVCKPYSPLEVIARINAVLRRTHRQPQPFLSDNTSTFQLNESQLSVTINGTTLALTAIECRLLALMSSQPGRVFSRVQIIEKAYTDHRIVNDRSIDSHIKKLRKKIKQIGGNDYLHSVYGAGYKFEVN